MPMSEPVCVTLSEAAINVLTTADPPEKARKSRDYVLAWRNGDIQDIGCATPPDRPARPEQPVLKDPTQMPKRAKAGSLRAKTALLHALAHIEFNAIDLAWDIMARFAGYSDENNPDGFSLPRAFFDDWCKVADDEAKHFLMLERRLHDLGAKYGDLPAHDGLWEASEKTAHDFAARLAIVPMVLEARGLDVTPQMIAAMKKQDDHTTADILKIIHDDEITHVKAGTDWFKSWCDYHNQDVETGWQDLVRTYFNGKLKRPFNDPSRLEAGMLKHWYDPLADDLNA